MMDGKKSRFDRMREENRRIPELRKKAAGAGQPAKGKAPGLSDKAAEQLANAIRILSVEKK
jgi:hypothetical protein